MNHVSDDAFELFYDLFSPSCSKHTPKCHHVTHFSIYGYEEEMGGAPVFSDVSRFLRYRWTIYDFFTRSRSKCSPSVSLFAIVSLLKKTRNLLLNIICEASI